jgi:amidase
MTLPATDALTLSAMIARREVSAAEVMAATLNEIASRNPAVNALVSLRDGDALMAAARAADAAEPRGWLHGIPFAVKDLADAAGLPTSQGSPLFAGQVAARDSLFVARIRAAGAIIIGKTNTPEWGLGSHTFNPVFGATRNPWDLGRSAGGSSGGAAAALALGLVAVADGSDMMGSLRNPAGWCNVYGLRPSWGLIPAEPQGDVFLHQLATAGPMARTPGDLAALLATMAGPDPRLPQGRGAFAAAADPAADLAGRRIGWLGDWGGALPMEAGVIDQAQAGLGAFAELGLSVEALPPPFDADAMWRSWCDLRSWAVAMSLAPIADDPERARALKPEAWWEVARGRGLSAEAVHRASVVRSDWFRAAVSLFERFDALVLPTAQCWPFPVDWRWPAEIAGVAMDSYHRWMQVVVPASLIGLPVVALPLGPGPGGLPGGLQLIGAPGSDQRLLQMAECWHRAWPGARARPAGVQRGAAA